MNKILVVSLDKKFKNDERAVKIVAKKILGYFKKENTSVEIYLAGNRLMRSLNKKLRGKDKIADVLSFEHPNDFIDGAAKKLKPLGEVYLNIEMEERNFSKEFLVLHGILHLLGYDHIKKVDRLKMTAKEKSASRKLNISNKN